MITDVKKTTRPVHTSDPGGPSQCSGSDIGGVSSGGGGGTRGFGKGDRVELTMAVVGMATARAGGGGGHGNYGSGSICDGDAKERQGIVTLPPLHPDVVVRFLSIASSAT